ncbi:MAG: radical SAM protein [Calditrichaeota bacterium]|nr:MAG: radical SAM protein [Calditrichota bacterium]
MFIKQPLRTLFKIFIQKVPVEAQLIVTRQCNLSCGYCCEYDNYSPPIPVSVLKKRIDVLHRLGVINIALLGGEPLLHPQIAELVAYANRKAQVSITTNGFLLSDRLIEKLNKAGLSNMQISVDSLYPDPDLYIQKSLKSLSPKLNRLLEKARFDFHVKIVLCEFNKDQLIATIQELNKLGIAVSVNLIHNHHGCIDIHGEEYIRLWDYSFQWAPLIAWAEYDYGRQLLQGKRPVWLCRGGARFLYVDEFGNVQYCSQQIGRLNKPITQFTKKDVLKNLKTPKGCERGCAVFCVYRSSLVDSSPTTWMKVFYQSLVGKRIIRFF